MGLRLGKAYLLLAREGHARGCPKPRVSASQALVVESVFAASGSIARAAKQAGISHPAARKVLVGAGAVPARTQPVDRSAQREQFLVLTGQGWSTARAAREVRVSERTGGCWRRAGSRYACAVSTDAPTSNRYLSLEDRLVIADALMTGQSLRAVATRINKNVSTVSREVRARSIDGIYVPYQADRAAQAARARPKPSKLVTHHALRAEVKEGLERKLSPEQISHRLISDHPDDESMRVSHETIYQALYFQARGGLKREVQSALRTGRTRRKPHRQLDQRTHRFVDPMVMISDRPAEIDDRAVPGHWEGDLIMGSGNASAIGTLVERTTRYTMLLHLPHGHAAEHVRDALVATISTLPQHLRGSLTWDQGKEMARHAQFSTATDMAVYFCDPASPWQRGSNENTNGLLRQYFPKGTDLSLHGPEDLEHVAQELNGRPRKTLGWDTPAERLRDLLTT